MPASFRPLLVAAVLVAALAACDDPYALEASQDVVTDTLVLYGVNTAPIGFPTAVNLVGIPSGTGAVRATAAFTFDLVTDIRADGSVALIPNRRFASGISLPAGQSPYQVGLQRITGSFDALDRAPASGYTYDSTFVLRAGEAVVVQSFAPAACPIAFLGTNIYAKLIVDSVRTSVPERAYVRATVDPNCGFRSLAPGRPEE